MFDVFHISVSFRKKKLSTFPIYFTSMQLCTLRVKEERQLKTGWRGFKIQFLPSVQEKGLVYIRSAYSTHCKQYEMIMDSNESGGRLPTSSPAFCPPPDIPTSFQINQNVHLHTKLWEGHQRYLYVAGWWKQEGNFCMLHDEWTMNARCKFSAYKFDFHYSARKRGVTHRRGNTNKQRKTKNPSVFILVSLTRGVSRESGGPRHEGSDPLPPPDPKTSWHAELEETISLINHYMIFYFHKTFSFLGGCQHNSKSSRGAPWGGGSGGSGYVRSTL